MTIDFVLDAAMSQTGCVRATAEALFVEQQLSEENTQEP